MSLQELTDERYYVQQGIKQYGGGFMKALANAMGHADSTNLRKIKKTWSAEWNRYLKWGKGDFSAGNKTGADNA